MADDISGQNQTLVPEPVSQAAIGGATEKRSRLHAPVASRTLVIWAIAVFVCAALWTPAVIPGAPSKIWAFSWSLFVWGVFCTLGFALAAGFKKLTAEGESLRARARAKSDAQRHEQMRSFLMTPLVPLTATALVLKHSETCFLQSPAELYSVHKHTYRVGGYGGPSIRIARGVYWRMGSFASAPVTKEGMESDGKGTLYLTDKRFVFVGPTKSVEIPFTRIASAEPFIDGLRLDVVNKTPIILVTGSFWLYAIFQRIEGNLTGAVAENQLPEDLREPVPALNATDAVPQPPVKGDPPYVAIAIILALISFLGARAWSTTVRENPTTHRHLIKAHRPLVHSKVGHTRAPALPK